MNPVVGKSKGKEIPGDIERIRLGLAALLSAAVIVLLGVELLAGPSASSSDGAGRSFVLSESELVARAGFITPKPYWVGPRPNVRRFELERDSSNSLFIRYLPDGRSEDDPESLRVATYPVPDARKSLESAAISSGVPLSEVPGSMVLAPGNGPSAYVVFDDQPDLQVEVFSPTPGEAAKIVANGELIPLGWGPIK